jgi:hypothetical protein
MVEPFGRRYETTDDEYVQYKNRTPLLVPKLQVSYSGPRIFVGIDIV